MNHTTIIKIGDLLMRPKFPGVEHKGVVVGNNLVCHNTPEKGEHVSTVQEFATGRPLRVRQTGANPQDVISRTNKVLASPKGYDPLRRNCEHTSFEILFGAANSPFVSVCLLMLAGISVAALLSRR